MSIDVHGMVAELTRTHVVQTPWPPDPNGTVRPGFCYTRAPALLIQLEHATPSSSADARGSAGFGSRPAARLEALDALIHIDTEASWWVRHLGDDDPSSTIACVQRVGALYPSQDDHQQKAITRDIRQWWNQARITTGYDSPAWRPDNTCPLCEKPKTLRVKLSTHTALCIGCWETWDEHTIGFLADHIRLENCEDDTELPTDTPDEAV